jgi:predicted enzyme related to lactoylglutathione lyase
MLFSSIISEEDTTMQHSINWFEIPSTDFDRAVTFYNEVFGEALRRDTFMGVPYGFFPYEPGVVSGAVIGGGVSGASGPLLYLNAGNNLDAMLARVEAAGGTIEQPRTSLGPQGFMAVIIDSEGNRIALHQISA